jgi:predicted transcriptional regulator
MSSETKRQSFPGPGSGPRRVDDADERPSAPAEGVPLELTEPKTMRALAHPVRMALMELFSVNETLTATQASEVLGESPANCAFHLRTLAKYGLIEEAGGGRGRERPWKARYKTILISSISGLEGEQAKPAASALTHAFVDRWLGSIRSRVMANAGSPEWENAVLAHHSLVLLTPDEAIGVGGEIRAIFDRYRHRRGDPASRPEEALPFEYSVFGYPRADLSALLQAPDPGTSDAPDGDGASAADPRA